MKKINSLLRRCKTLSRQLGRSSSYSAFRSKSSRDQSYQHVSLARNVVQDKEPCETIFVGTSRRRYVISSKHLSHPLLNALIQKSNAGRVGDDPDLAVKCEVVLFEHLLWMLENADPNYLASDSLEELAELYVY